MSEEDIEKLDRFLNIVSAMGRGSAEVWRAFECREIDALADLLRARGRRSTAEEILAMHAEKDHPGGSCAAARLPE